MKRTRKVKENRPLNSHVSTPSLDTRSERKASSVFVSVPVRWYTVQNQRTKEEKRKEKEEWASGMRKNRGPSHVQRRKAPHPLLSIIARLVRALSLSQTREGESQALQTVLISSAPCPSDDQITVQQHRVPLPRSKQVRSEPKEDKSTDFGSSFSE